MPRGHRPGGCGVLTCFEPTQASFTGCRHFGRSDRTSEAGRIPTARCAARGERHRRRRVQTAGKSDLWPLSVCRRSCGAGQRAARQSRSAPARRRDRRGDTRGLQATDPRYRAWECPGPAILFPLRHAYFCNALLSTPEMKLPAGRIVGTSWGPPGGRLSRQSVQHGDTNDLERPRRAGCGRRLPTAHGKCPPCRPFTWTPMI
jgi:hypothetical protein